MVCRRFGAAAYGSRAQIGSITEEQDYRAEQYGKQGYKVSTWLFSVLGMLQTNLFTSALQFHTPGAVSHAERLTLPPPLTLATSTERTGVIAIHLQKDNFTIP